MSAHPPLSPALVHVVSQAAADVIACPLSSISSPTPSPPLPPLPLFVAAVAARSKSSHASMLVTAILLDRARERLPASAKGVSPTAVCVLTAYTTGLPCTSHRLFLAALIIAAKAANDKTYKNKSFVVFTDNLFPVSEINLMERQLLHILDFNIMITSLEYDNVCERIRAVDAQMAAGISSSEPVSVPLPSPPTSHLGSSFPKSLPSLPSLSHRSFNIPSFMAKFTSNHSGHMSPVSPGNARVNSVASSYSSSFANGGFMRSTSPGHGKRMDSASAFVAPSWM
ncbi:hypothetical protein HDU84_005250 [Entophlyctis sp. JEL0112]|nr:hypothetical protein HDU84_005250 [Entophlyctis sp. JEL0112]